MPATATVDAGQPEQAPAALASAQAAAPTAAAGKTSRSTSEEISTIDRLVSHRLDFSAPVISGRSSRGDHKFEHRQQAEDSQEHRQADDRLGNEIHSIHGSGRGMPVTRLGRRARSPATVPRRGSRRLPQAAAARAIPPCAFRRSTATDFDGERIGSVVKASAMPCARIAGSTSRPFSPCDKLLAILGRATSTRSGSKPWKTGSERTANPIRASSSSVMSRSDADMIDHQVDHASWSVGQWHGLSRDWLPPS